MTFVKRKSCQLILLLLLCFNNSVVFSSSQPTNHAFLSMLPASVMHGHFALQIGGYQSIAGASQHVNIADLIGNEFTVTQSGGSNALIGLSYFTGGQQGKAFQMVYGVNLFYFPKTSVEGSVIQEDAQTNLVYRYQLTHYPVFVVAKSIIKTKWSGYDVVLDVGAGQNFMRASGFSEYTLNANTIPDNIFVSHTTATFAATIGLAFKFNNIILPTKTPLECGYRFFYLGKGHFDAATNQVGTRLNTGSVFGNALLCSMSV